MKLLPDIGWLAVLCSWRGARRRGPDAGDMGTAFGLDSITVVDFDSTQDPHAEGGTPSVQDWNRRLARRSRL